MAGYPHSYLYSSSRGRCFNGIIYFIAGIPDICTMIRKIYRYYKYEESFLELEIDHVSNLKACIVNIEQQIKELGGKVVFATIATSSFRE